MVCTRQITLQLHESIIPVCNVGCLEGFGGGTVLGRQWGAVDGRHVQEQKVPSSGLVQLVDETGVFGKDDGVERCVLGRIAVADVVDADEDPEESVGA